MVFLMAKRALSEFMYSGFVAFMRTVKKSSDQVKATTPSKNQKSHKKEGKHVESAKTEETGKLKTSLINTKKNKWGKTDKRKEERVSSNPPMWQATTGQMSDKEPLCLVDYATSVWKRIF